MLTQEQQAISSNLSSGNVFPGFFKALTAVIGKKKRPATTASQQTAAGKRKAT
jgi:hypothetical protein